MLIRSFSIIFSTLLLCSNLVIAQHGTEDEGHSEEGNHHSQEVHEEEYNASEVILEHILDTHDWHITDIPAGTDKQGHTKYIPIAIHLPFMFYSSRDGFVFAANRESLLEKNYLFHHQHIYALEGGTDVQSHMDSHGHFHLKGDAWDTWKGKHIQSEVSIIDFSITKTVLQMLLVGIIMLLVFGGMARLYKENTLTAPKGIQSFLEPIIVFIRDDIARNYLGKDAIRFLPYLLTLFFFIWFANLFGLMPFNSNIMGNISVTAALAVLTFIITQFNGSKDHWNHIFNTPGVPWWLKFGIPLMPIVEFIGLFTKPFALAVRLFANITAGHFMVLGLISLIFILGNAGENLIGGLAITPLSVIFTVVIFALEMIVAIVQAYVFTLLTAVFVGMAMETHDDHH